MLGGLTHSAQRISIKKGRPPSMTALLEVARDSFVAPGNGGTPPLSLTEATDSRNRKR
jgi:hypothetical protein